MSSGFDYMPDVPQTTGISPQHLRKKIRVVHIGNWSCAQTSHAPYKEVIKWKHFRVTGLLYGEFTGDKDQWRGALVFSLICTLDKRLSKQSCGLWFETPWRSLWSHCNDITCIRRFGDVLCGNYHSGSWWIYLMGLYMLSQEIFYMHWRNPMIVTDSSK